MTRDEIAALAAPHHLSIFGVAPWEGQNVVLLGPAEPGFWAAFQQSPEWQDGQQDPMDRWSERVIGAVADELGVKASYPFGETGAHFLRWIMESDASWQSPVGMIVQARAGLLASYRGALIVENLAPAPQPSPCTSCHKPCATACPVGALTEDGYDVPTCKAHISSAKGVACHSGCLVRLACPISQTYARDPKQSEYHMERFLA